MLGSLSPNVRESGIWEIFLLESGNYDKGQVLWILLIIGIRNPSSTDKEFRIRYPWRRTENPRLSDFLVWAVYFPSVSVFNCILLPMKKKKKKKALSLSVNVFSTEVLFGDTILTSPTGDGTAILRGHPSHAKVQPPAGQREYLHFSVILRP